MEAIKEIPKRVTHLPKVKVRKTTPTERHTPMSYTKWLDAFNEETHTEWVNGEAIVFMPPTEEHQEIITFLTALLESYVLHFNIGQLLVAPFEMKATPESNAREPDMLFVATEHLSRLTGKKLEGAADLVIEVISPESVYRDRSDKFDEYQAAGVQEYWLIDSRPGQQQASFWVLDQNGRYRAAAIEENGVYRSSVITDFWLNINWLWMKRKPSPILLLAEIVGRERLIEMIVNDNSI